MMTFPIYEYIIWKKHVPNISKAPASYYFDMTITKHNHRLRRVAQAIPALEQRHAVALRLQLSGGADAAHAGAHHDHVLRAGRKEGLDSEIWSILCGILFEFLDL